MNIIWKKSSIRRDVLIAFVVICMAFAAYCQSSTSQSKTSTRTTKAFTLLEDNPLYVQHFVSKMMSRYPMSTFTLPRDVTGMEHGPNLGYEPYWWDVQDLTWEQKCARCPYLFSQYKMLCATDGTGDVTVNISMCNVMKQNCLAGSAWGRSTGKKNDFQGEYFVVKDGWAHVAFRQQFGALIQLSTTPDTTGNRYTIQIDGWSGFWSVIYRNDRVLQWHYGKHTSLNQNIYVDYVIRWHSNGWLLVTKRSYQNWTLSFNLNITDPEPFPIKYIAVGGFDGHAGDWILKDFMVTSLRPCAESAVAQSLVTSATDVAEIMREEKLINKAYFKRFNESGLHRDNISFYTMEEY